MFALWQALALLSSARGFSENRIVNGTDAKPGEISYIVSLKHGNFHHCGATIINEYWVLTAAHCVYGHKPNNFNVQYGVTRLTSDGANTIPIEHFIYHPDYAPKKGKHDVAVVKLQEPIEFSEFAQPVGLPLAFNATPGGAQAIASGWGYLEHEGETTDDLQRVDLDVYTDEDCERVLSDTDRRYHVCGGVIGGGKGICFGDSGGPLVVNGTQVGITSWIAERCGGPNYPGVFAKVSSYVQWIHENIAE